MSQKTITINGRLYDTHTGMPVDAASEETPSVTPQNSSPKRSPLHHSQAIHQTPQKSHTLNRRVVKKLTASQASPNKATQKSPHITKFASHPSGVKPRVVTDIGPSVHPHVAKANQSLATKKQVVHTTPKPSHIIKEEAIQDALKKAPSKTDKVEKVKKPRRFSRFASISSAALALLLLGGYFTYLNMPNLSVRVAAAQAGINASYPEYRPDGYSLKGPIGYSEGQVSMKFAANAGPQSYTVSEQKSGWDSSAVLDNYVKAKAGENYITYNERGLTIYTFDGNAAWVNGGILYTISGDAPLSSDQIRRIAVSM